MFCFSAELYGATVHFLAPQQYFYSKNKIQKTIEFMASYLDNFTTIFCSINKT